MIYRYKHVVLASLLAVVGATAAAQSTSPAPGDAPTTTVREQGARPDSGRFQARMQERHSKRMSWLKQRLGITTAQEAAWAGFAAAMAPTGRMAAQRPNRSEFRSLTTPQRIDRMRALRDQRNAAMDKRADATKAFYAQLSAEQQKTFDDLSPRMGKRRAGGMHFGNPRHHG